MTNGKGVLPLGETLLAARLETSVVPAVGVEVYEAGWVMDRDGVRYLMRPGEVTRELRSDERYIVAGKAPDDGLLDVVVSVSVPWIDAQHVLTPSGSRRGVNVRVMELARMSLLQYRERVREALERG